MKRNLILLWIRDIFFAIANTLASSSVISAFLLTYGMSEERVSFYITFGTVVTFATSILCSGTTAHVRQTPRVLAVCQAVMASCTAFYTVFAVRTFSPNLFFTLLLLVSGISSFASSIKTIFEYKLPCEVMDLDKYGAYISVAGTVSGLVGMGVGVVATFLYAKYDYGKVSVAVFLASAVFMVAAGGFNAMLRQIHEPQLAPKSKNSLTLLLDLFHNKSFLVLLVPNFIRASGPALISLAAVLTVKNGVLTPGECALIATLSSAGSMAANVLYLPMTKLLHRPATGLAGALAFCLVFPAFLTADKVVFFVCYTVAYTGMTVMGNAVPDMIYQNIPSDIISPFNTWRMILLNLGSAASTALLGLLINRTTTFVLVFIGAAGFLGCALTYYIFYRKTEPFVHKKEKKIVP